MCIFLAQNEYPSVVVPVLTSGETQRCRFYPLERASASWVPTIGKNLWEGATNDSLFTEFLDQYQNCLLSY
jgi:hypothetical protein